MTEMQFVIGVDPGPVVGLCLLRHPYAQPKLVQADAVSAMEIARYWLREFQVALIACERFVEGRRAGRTAGRHGSAAARDFVGWLNGAHLAVGSYVHDGFREAAVLSQAAGTVKPWATDARLTRAGIVIDNPSTMRHALDAGRHALYAGCAGLGWPDPLAGKAADHG